MELEKRFGFFESLGLAAAVLFLGLLCIGNPSVREEGTRKKFFWRNELIRQEFDSNKDGRTDIWQHLHHGAPTVLEIDSNFDRKIDTWGFYEKGGGALKTIRADSDFDGRIDYFGPPAFKIKIDDKQ